MSPDRHIGAFGDVACRAGRVGMHDRCQAEAAKPFAALGKALRVAVDLDKPVDGRALWRQKVMIDALEMLAIDEQSRSGKKMVDIGNPARDRVFDRHHGKRGAAFLNGKDHVLERGAGSTSISGFTAWQAICE